MTTLRDIMKALPEERRQRIEARTAALIAEEQTLRDLRKALAKTQKKIAKTLNVGQDSVSRMEQRSDLLLSTLRGYVAALGGDLRLVAEFPDRPPVVLTGLGDVTPPKPAGPKPRAAASRRRAA